MNALSASGEMNTSCEVPGEATEHQVFHLPPDTWHYVTFKLKNTQDSSDPPVPLNTTLFELFEVTGKAKLGTENEGLQKEKWPYSSRSLKRLAFSLLFSLNQVLEIVTTLTVVVNSYDKKAQVIVDSGQAKSTDYFAVTLLTLQTTGIVKFLTQL